MSTTMHVRTKVLPGNRIEITTPELAVGEEVEVTVVADAQPAGTDAAAPIWEVVRAIGEAVPESDWATVPTDLSKNIHHYLYGAPKERVMMLTPLATNQSIAAWVSAVVAVVARNSSAPGAMSLTTSATATP